jgi:two-component system sensor kinase FixL
MLNPSRKYDVNDRLYASVAHATDGILMTDQKGRIDFINPAAAGLFGYSYDEMLEKPLAELVSGNHPQALDDFYAGSSEVAALLKNGSEMLGKRKDGTTIPLLMKVSRVSSGEQTWCLFFIHDITEYKHSIQALQESENKINAILTNAVDGIITINREGIMEMVNPAASRIFGYEPGELLGQKVDVLMPEPDRSRHDGYMRNYFQTGVGKIIGIGREVTGKRKDGSTFPFHLSISEVALYDRKVFTGIIHDITYQKMAEEKLRRYATELERSNRDLQDFAYVSSHDLQEPLRKIQAFGDRLRSKEADNLTEQGKEYIDRMLNAASRMQNLINDLLSFSRVTTKTQSFVWTDLNAILDGVLSDLEVSIEKSGAQIERSSLPSLEAEPTQMRQLFQNLIANALKFRKPDTQPLIQIYARQHQRKAHLTSTPGDETIEIFVEDNGIGFDEKYLDRIFNVFQRLDGHKYEGSGIGLALCRKIAVGHGGNITARSQPGKGAVFIVTLSVKQTKNSEYDFQS